MTKKIAPGVYRLSVGGVGAFLLDDDGAVTVVDTGLPGNVDEIWGGLKTIGRSPKDVKNILVTHYHQDHIGCLAPLTQGTDATVYAPAGEAAFIRSGGMAPPLKSRGFLGAVLSRFLKMSEQPPNKVDEEVDDGDTLPIAGGIQVVGTKGHSVGHVAYLWPQHGGVLFPGDAAMTFLGKVRAMPIAEDFDGADRSFARLAGLDFAAAGFAHGAPIRSRAAARFRSAL
ncbi:MAG: hypothetical protein QOH26_1881 [Actinomycetota bacterium]|jgi:glyoxylase-like metal-dependent hydrolase (beta-lactamase superfamily II)|nr:hypothetical protein [Actinomycetota bacterium]